MRVNQILLNLLSNAIKFTPKRRQCQAGNQKSRSASDKIWLRFIVKDSGIGMKKEFLEHLYEPFEQADNELPENMAVRAWGWHNQNLVAIMDGTIELKVRKVQELRLW